MRACLVDVRAWVVVRGLGRGEFHSVVYGLGWGEPAWVVSSLLGRELGAAVSVTRA